MRRWLGLIAASLLLATADAGVTHASAGGGASVVRATNVARPTADASVPREPRMDRAGAASRTRP